MKFVPRREKNRKAFNSPEGLAILSKATGAAKKDNDARAADPWTSGGAKTNQWRDPMPSVTVTSPSQRTRTSFLQRTTATTTSQLRQRMNNGY